MPTRLAAVVVLACACGPTASMQTGDLHAEHDRFTGNDRIVMDTMHVPCGFCENYYFTGKAKAGGPASLILERSFKDWTWMECHRVDMLVDGLPMQPDSVAWDGDAHLGGVTEWVTMTFIGENIEQLASASTVEIRVCGDEIELTPTNVESVSAFMAAASSEAPSTTRKPVLK